MTSREIKDLGGRIENPFRRHAFHVHTRATLFHEAQNEKEPNLLECVIWGRQGQRNAFEMRGWGGGELKVSLFEGKAPVEVTELSGLKKAGKHEIVIYNFRSGLPSFAESVSIFN
ncbi:hypothetical protein CDAR_266161 [Caerostris darwini]|uniref:Single-stranded DNA-binding protein n=1 Tax=Caerostris darwini TaxID=1538125 RepID=A0AAV4ML93_9ARAC|nr:hypothetical protein CDAR_266161 [Caerostris darwini]